MIPILDARRMRAADAAAIRGGVPSLTLMENAARSLAAELVASLPLASKIVVACGPGNNGGDGLAAARLLARRGLSVSVFTLRDPDSYQGDAAENARRAREAGIDLVALEDSRGRRAFARAMRDSDAVVDALFGTGLTRALSGGAAKAVAAINAAQRPVVAADLPSGLSADTGERIGPAVRAGWTVAFAAYKHPHVFFPARDLCGRVVVADIGIPERSLSPRRPAFEAAGADDLEAWLPRRPGDSHKGDFGRLAIVAGSRGKAGAAALAARGALRAGAGLVTVFCPASVEPIIVSALPEAMTRPMPEEDGALAEEAAERFLSESRSFDAAAIGPGLGTAPETVAAVERILSANLPIVCDADALNAFAGRPRALARRQPSVLTPHPGEAGRLLGASTASIQRDRPGAVRRLARATRAVVILKGASTLIAQGSGPIAVNPTGSPLMATAGSGDVLTGATGAFLARGIPAEHAAVAAAYLHGLAGEILAETLGDSGLLAGELADSLPAARRSLASRRGEWPAKS